MTHNERERLATRLLKFVDKRDDGCWWWTGCVTGGNSAGDGYGSFHFANRQPRSQRAHRVAYELFVGPIPEGLQLDHLCRNKLCVNPAHLEPVTAAENKRRDYESRGVCRNGLHLKTPENTYVPLGADNARCLLCMRATQGRYRARKKLRLVSASGAESPRGVGRAVSAPDTAQAAPEAAVVSSPPPGADAPSAPEQLDLLGSAAENAARVAA